MPHPSIVVQPKVPSKTELLSKLRLRVEHWHTYQAMLYIKAESSKGNFAIRAAVLAAPPDHLRLEAFNLFGQTAGLLLLNREGSSLWTPSEKVLYTADRPESLIQHFLGVPVPVETLEYGLIACVPPRRLEGLRFVQRDSDWLGYSEESVHGSFLLWKFSSQPLALKTMEVREAQWRYLITYDPPVELNPLFSPRKIRFVSSEWSMEVTVEQMKDSPALSRDVFNPPFPSSIRRINLDSKQ
jgi:hypothetical protein